MLERQFAFTDKQIKKYSLILSLVLVFCMYVFCIVTTQMTYHTNDDYGQQMSLVSSEWGSLYWLHPNLNICSAPVLVFFSRLFPKVAIWYYYSHLLMIIGIVLFNYVFLCLSFKKRTCRTILPVFLALFDIVYILSWISECCFTTVPAILGGGILALLFLQLRKTKEPFSKTVIAVIFILYYLCCCHRDSSAKVLLPFFVLVLSYVCIKISGVGCKSFLQIGLLSIALVLMFFIIDGIDTKVHVMINDEEYIRFNKARAAFMDHTHDDYSANPELYEAVGWTEDTYNFAISWNFLSPEINTENLEYIVENSNTSVHNQKRSENFQYFWQQIIDNDTMKQLLIVTALLSVVAILVTLKNKKWLELTLCLSTMLLMSAMIYYLCVIAGRINSRGLFTVLYPTATITMLIVSMNLAEFKNRGGILLLLILLLVLPAALRLDYMKQGRQYYENLYEIQKCRQDFFASNENNIYVGNLSGGIGPYLATDHYLWNWFVMGGASWKNSVWHHFCEVNNLDTIDWKIFEKDNVYYYGFDDEKLVNYISYLCKNYNCKGAVQIDSIPGIEGLNIYKFIYDTNIEQYDNYPIKRAD